MKIKRCNMIYHHDWEPYWDYYQYHGFDLKWFIRWRFWIIRPFVLRKYRRYGAYLPPTYSQWRRARKG